MNEQRAALCWVEMSAGNIARPANAAAATAHILRHIDAAVASERRAHEETRAALARVSDDLRHAYLNLVAGRVIIGGMREFADGLIAPQIRKLEKLSASDVAPTSKEPK